MGGVRTRCRDCYDRVTEPVCAGACCCESSPRPLAHLVPRDLEPEGAAPAGHALDPDPTLVELDRVLHDREPQAGPSRRARAAAIDPIKALENPWQVL